jgi:hypothetical protein
MERRGLMRERQRREENRHRREERAERERGRGGERVAEVVMQLALAD